MPEGQRERRYPRFRKLAKSSSATAVTGGAREFFQGIGNNPDWHVRDFERRKTCCLSQLKKDAYFRLSLSERADESDMTEVFRFFNTTTGVHFYTGSTAERDSVIANLPQFNFEGAAFSVSSEGATITSVHRFVKNDGTHFYTVSDVERDTIQNSNPAYTYEGVAYNAARGQTEANNTPLYRESDGTGQYYRHSASIQF